MTRDVTQEVMIDVFAPVFAVALILAFIAMFGYKLMKPPQEVYKKPPYVGRHHKVREEKVTKTENEIDDVITTMDIYIGRTN